MTHTADTSNEKRLRAIVAAQQSIGAASSDLGPLLEVAVTAAVSACAAQSAVLELVEGTDLVAHAVSGAADIPLRRRINLPSTASDQVLSSGDLVRWDEADADGGVCVGEAHELRARSMIIAPLRSGESVVGVLKVASRTPGAFTDDDDDALRLLATLTSAALTRVEDLESVTRRSVAKNEFMSRMSHEIRTPLNAILGFAQLMDLDDLEGSQQEAIDQIIKAGRHLLNLIDEVLDISTMETGALPLSLEPVRLDSVVADAVELIRPLAQSAQITLSAPEEGQPDLYVTADQQRLQQALLNLLTNAIKFNRVGGDVRISSTGNGPAGTHRIEVTDTGLGMTPDQLQKAFEPFERLGAESDGVEGTGLGLALSLRLVEAMGGSLSAASEPGTGSTFSIDLVATAAPTDHHEVPASEDERRPGAGTVLYVEDNPANVRLVQRAITRHSAAALITATSGETGIDLARSHRPDLILLDLHLPGINGDEVLRELLADPATSHIPVVIISADATPSVVDRLRSDGAAEYMTKPIDLHGLLRVIDTYTGAPQARSVAAPR